MIRLIKNHYTLAGATLVAGMMSGASDVMAANTFSDISNNIGTGIGSIPGLLSSLAYLFGLILAILGILKIKDHVENPNNTPLREGVIRLLVGGFLFGLPILSEAMLGSINDGSGKAVTAAKLNKVDVAAAIQ